MSRIIPIALALSAFALCGAVAGQPAAYPAKGQSASQQQKDEGECHTWAKGKTGIDPAAVAAAPAPAPAPGGQRLKGAVVGGVVGGAVGGDDGAKGGAAVGIVAGGAKSRQQKRAAEQQHQQSSQQQIDTFYRAYASCLQGRGYTVK